MIHPDFNAIAAAQHRQELQHEAEMARLVQQLDVGISGHQRKQTLVIRAALGVGLAAFGLGLLIGGLVVEADGLVPTAMILACLSLFVALPLLIQSL